MSYWKEKAALVTGGSAGLGLAIACELVRSGARVAIAGRDTRRLQDAVQSLRHEPVLGSLPPASEEKSNRPAIVGIEADITQQEQVESLIQQTLIAFDRLDLLVNCAGKSARGAVAEVTPEEYRELWELNFLAQVRCARACLPHLLKSKGHLVNLGSLASKTASPFLAAYAASKFPVAAFSQQLRLELGSQGLHVLLVCPGPIRRDDPGIRYEQATGVPQSARLPGGGVKLKGIDPHALARHILLACERRSPELVVPAKARLLFVIAQLWPRLGDWIVRRMTGS
jgi:NAD(P)-dependent dehydrogenase (short-subunit alcohol dehydrogenase family)